MSGRLWSGGSGSAGSRLMCYFACLTLQLLTDVKQSSAPAACSRTFPALGGYSPSPRRAPGCAHGPAAPACPERIRGEIEDVRDGLQAEMDELRLNHQRRQGRVQWDEDELGRTRFFVLLVFLLQ